MTAETTTKQKIGFIGGVVRGPPPDTCATTCKDRLTEICHTCRNRPITSVSISYGKEPSVEAAIAKGLTTREAAEAFRKQITGG